MWYLKKKFFNIDILTNSQPKLNNYYQISKYFIDNKVVHPFDTYQQLHTNNTIIFFIIIKHPKPKNFIIICNDISCKIEW